MLGGYMPPHEMKIVRSKVPCVCTLCGDTDFVLQPKDKLKAFVKVPGEVADFFIDKQVPANHIWKVHMVLLITEEEIEDDHTHDEE
jgi:hypothetical protein